MKHIKRSKRITREKLSTEDLLFLEELKAHTDLLYRLGIPKIIQGHLNDVDSLLQRLNIKQASEAPEEVTKDYLEATIQLLDKLAQKKGFGSRCAAGGALELRDALRKAL